MNALTFRRPPHLRQGCSRGLSLGPPRVIPPGAAPIAESGASVDPLAEALLHLDGAVGIDFFDIPTATFDVLRGFLVIDHKRRKLLHLGVTKHPTAEWTANQLPEAFSGNSTPRLLFRDRDAIYGARFIAKVNALGITEVISAPRSPWENPFAERVVGSLRRELLDHVIVINERHATKLLRDYQANYYNSSRTHLGLAKDAPLGRPVQSAEAGTEIISVPILGGLHHRYERRAA
jgi:putative transposase